MLSISAAGSSIFRQTWPFLQFFLFISAAGSSIFGQTTTKAQGTGLGGVDPKTSTVTSG